MDKGGRRGCHGVDRSLNLGVEMAQRQLLLLSSSRLHGYKYLEHAREEIDTLLKGKNVTKILFIPFALKDYDRYTEIVKEPLNAWGYEVEGIHTKKNEIEAIKNAQSIFIGGGNTFVLLKTLYEKKLIDPIRLQVLENGVPYMGSSAGTNVATRSINTTNDMPVVHPPTFDALNLVPFNINPHYIEPEIDTKHKGETRDERIFEFIEYNRLPVLGLREGTSIYVKGDKIVLMGKRQAKVFYSNKTTAEFCPGDDLSFLLNEIK